LLSFVTFQGLLGNGPFAVVAGQRLKTTYNFIAKVTTRITWHISTDFKGKIL